MQTLIDRLDFEPRSVIYQSYLHGQFFSFVFQLVGKCYPGDSVRYLCLESPRFFCRNQFSVQIVFTHAGNYFQLLLLVKSGFYKFACIRIITLNHQGEKLIGFFLSSILGPRRKKIKKTFLKTE